MLSHSNPVYSGFKKKEFAWELQTLMGIPCEVKYSKGGFRYEKPTHATRAIQAILQVITDALHRGEKVNIPGFGTFYIKERPALKRRLILDATSDGKLLAQTDELVEVPAKKIVAFKPSIHLEALLNEENPNWEQCRAMRTWK